MPAPQGERLRSIKTFPKLVEYLRDDLEWPIESDNFDDLTFEYDAEELGLDANTAVKVRKAHQLRPLRSNQPWGIFFLDFEPKKLPVVVLRRILGALVKKKRHSAKNADRKVWDLHDLLFISAYGESAHRDLTFAHFAEAGANGDLPVLRVLGWDDEDTAHHLEHAHQTLREKLRWPDDGTSVEIWRKTWATAFTTRHGEVISTSKMLAVRLAELARQIRKRANTVLSIETDKGPFRKLQTAFRESLIHDLGDDDFADAYAQTVAYGLLSARVSRPAGLVTNDVVQMAPVTNPFLEELLKSFLTVGGRNDTFDFDEFGVSEVTDMLRHANMEAVIRDFGDKNPFEDPVIHFYELFLKEYDPEKRIERGVFYTPRPVVSYIVHAVHELLQTEFGLPDGLADTATWGDMAMRHAGLKLPDGVKPTDRFVTILDPATGTGTFLVEVIEVIYDTMTAKWHREGKRNQQITDLWNKYVPEHLLPRLHGYELMMAPYAIAHMKVGLKLAETQYRFSSTERARVYLTDALEPAQDLDYNLFTVPALKHESRAVNDVKRHQRFTVIIGNPPYLRESDGIGAGGRRVGGWIRHGSGTGTPLFDDFIRPLSETGRGVHAKLAYELSVIFWRLAGWLCFQGHNFPGVIGFISPRAYISGPGHFGMRRWLHKNASCIRVTDLGGDTRGARPSENVFEIRTGVSIAVCARNPKPRSFQAFYQEITGTKDEKLAILQDPPDATSQPWQECPPDADAFRPAVGEDYPKWPALADLFPWQENGRQYKRMWPIGESQAVLAERWNCLVSLPRSKKAAAFKETDARKIASQPGNSGDKYTGIADLQTGTPVPSIVRYGYRTLDRHWALIDPMFADRPRPVLTAVVSPHQVFAATYMTKQLGQGAAVSLSAHLPDFEYFANRGAKDIIPLWRDREGTIPNITPGILAALAALIGTEITPARLFAYCIAIMGGPSYASTFERELATPGPRIPITQDANLFEQGALLGAKFVWFQTYGERWLSSTPAPAQLTGVARVSQPVPIDEGSYPETHRYDSQSKTLLVGTGSFVNVEPEVYDYSVSGFSPVRSWLGYRMKVRAGRGGRADSSDLEKIRPRCWTFTQELLELLWVVEGCVTLHPELASFLVAVTAGPTLQANEFPSPSETDRENIAIRTPNGSAGGGLF